MINLNVDVSKIKSSKDRYIEAFKEFFDKMYGVDLDYSKTIEYQNYLKKVEEAAKKYGDDFDVMLTIKHRRGDFTLKGIDAYIKTRSLLEVVEKGINLPDDVTSFEISAKIAVTKNGKREYLGKKEDVLFDERILLTDFAEDKYAVQLHTGQKISKMDKNIKAFSRKDLEGFTKLVRFKPLKKEDSVTI